MTHKSNESAVLDEAERLLEQIPDGSGYAVGGSALQMRANLSGRLSFNGALHAKTLIIEREDHDQGQNHIEWLGGSVNWSTASRGNIEAGLQIVVIAASSVGPEESKSSTLLAKKKQSNGSAETTRNKKQSVCRGR